MLPQGMFSVAVATVAFPALSRAASSRDGRLYRRTLTTGLRRIAFLLVPSSVACAVLAQPMVRLVFQHGRFDAAQTQVVAQALAAFSLGLTFNGFMLMLNRAFFSLQMPWGPTKIAVATLVANGVLDCRVLPALRRLGDPARDVVRQRDRHVPALTFAEAARRPAS